MKDQFDISETVLVRFPPFMSRSTGQYIIGGDTAQVIINKSGTPETHSLTWDSDSEMWSLDIAPPHVEGEWRLKAFSSDASAFPQYKVIVCGSHLLTSVNTTKTTTDLIKEKTDLIPEAHYRMRGFDTSLSQTVYWDSPAVDPSGAYYGGPGPLTDVVLVDRF